MIYHEKSKLLYEINFFLPETMWPGYIPRGDPGVKSNMCPT